MALREVLMMGIGFEDRMSGILAERLEGNAKIGESREALMTPSNG